MIVLKSMDSRMENVLREILNDPNRLHVNSQHEYKQKYPDFFAKFPRIGQMVFSSDKNHVSILQYMLKEKSKIFDEQSQYDASVRVGTLLRDEYISPLVDTEKKTN